MQVKAWAVVCAHAHAHVPRPAACCLNRKWYGTGHTLQNTRTTWSSGMQHARSAVAGALV